MSRMRQALLAGAVALVFAAAGVLFYQWQAADAPPSPEAAGRMLLGASLMGVDDRLQRFEQWRGKVLVVNFWATWCAPCREEIPGFIQIQARYGARGVQFVGVAIDQKARVAPYAKEMGINYPLLVGGLETMEFARQLGNRRSVLPYTLVVDRAGKVLVSQVGVLKPEKLEALLVPLL
ncbi:MAG: TlpA disulfide reductase family protein [Burkholderiales bacterium]